MNPSQNVITTGRLVRFESRLSPGRWSVGRVVVIVEDRAIVKDPKRRWSPQVVTLSRLELVRS